MSDSNPAPESTKAPAARGRRSWAPMRMLRYHLLIPIMRGRHDGVPTARGTAIGLAFGLTPTVGIQMPMIFVFWTLAKWFMPSWRFNLIVAFAWTWPTNLVTAPAYYYLCLITGKLMLGQGMGLEFDEFHAQISAVLTQDAGMLEAAWIYTVEIFRTWGVPMMVGCIPWAVVGTWLGYVLTLKFVNKLAAQQRKRFSKKIAKARA